MKDIYVKTTNKGTYVRSMVYKNGGIHVALDFNQERELIGVEILNATSLTIDGEEQL